MSRALVLCAYAFAVHILRSRRDILCISISVSTSKDKTKSSMIMWLGPTWAHRKSSMRECQRLDHIVIVIILRCGKMNDKWWFSFASSTLSSIHSSEPMMDISFCRFSSSGFFFEDFFRKSFVVVCVSTKTTQSGSNVARLNGLPFSRETIESDEINERHATGQSFRFDTIHVYLLYSAVYSGIYGYCVGRRRNTFSIDWRHIRFAFRQRLCDVMWCEGHFDCAIFRLQKHSRAMHGDEVWKSKAKFNFLRRHTHTHRQRENNTSLRWCSTKLVREKKNVLNWYIYCCDAMHSMCKWKPWPRHTSVLMTIPTNERMRKWARDEFGWCSCKGRVTNNFRANRTKSIRKNGRRERMREGTGKGERRAMGDRAKEIFISVIWDSETVYDSYQKQ